MDYKLACNTAGGSHHASYDYGAGYCVFNDVAVAANYLKFKKNKKILILDLMFIKEMEIQRFLKMIKIYLLLVCIVNQIIQQKNQKVI